MNTPKLTYSAYCYGSREDFPYKETRRRNRLEDAKSYMHSLLDLLAPVAGFEQTDVDQRHAEIDDITPEQLMSCESVIVAAWENIEIGICAYERDSYEIYYHGTKAYAEETLRKELATVPAEHVHIMLLIGRVKTVRGDVIRYVRLFVPSFRREGIAETWQITRLVAQWFGDNCNKDGEWPTTLYDGTITCGMKRLLDNDERYQVQTFFS